MRRKQYEELTLTDDFMFCRVFENNPELCRELVELILEREVGSIVDLQKQHMTDTVYDARSVRFDIHFKDDESRIYSIEMQTTNERNLPKRSRFYSSQMDLEQLDKGRLIAELRDTYVIFICTFNIAPEYYLARYSFERICMEKPEYELKDGSHLIVLCADNEDPNISKGLKNFLWYLAGRKAKDRFTEKLEAAVKNGRMSKEWRRDYMLMSEYMAEAKAEGRAEGRAEGEARGIRIFVADKREDGIAEDVIRERLILRFGLTAEEAQGYLDEN